MVSKKTAMGIFCYLALVDEMLSDEEKVRIDEIGNRIDPEEYGEYAGQMLNDCIAQTKKIIDPEDYYDVVCEGADRLLSGEEDSVEKPVGIRLLIWNLLVVANADGVYSSAERRFIKHIVRITDTEISVFLEMEQMIQTYQLLEKERDRLSHSDQPYSEVAPLMEAYDTRMNHIQDSALCLIADEELTLSIRAMVVKPDLIDNVAAGIKDTTSEAAKNIKNKVAPAAVAVKEKASPAMAQAGNKLNHMVSGAVSKFKRREPKEKE